MALESSAMSWALAIVLGAALVGVPAQAAPDTASATVTIRLVSNTTSARVLVDRAPKGKASKGDKQWAMSVLRNAVAQFDRPKGAVVGSDVGTLTVVSVTPPRVDLKVTVRLPGGTLRAAGRITGLDQDIPVIGGTGDFANARGTSEIRSLHPSGDPALNVYRLRLP